MNTAMIEFEAHCPDCGVDALWTAEQFGVYPDVRSKITRINHIEVK